VHVIKEAPEVLSDNAGRYTSYNFKFQIGTGLHMFKARYSVLWKFNEKLVMNSGAQAHLPKFPPKTWLSDMTKPKNYNKRADELFSYFKTLLKDPKFLKWHEFHKLLNLGPELRSKVMEIADSMISQRHVIEGSKIDSELANSKQASPNSSPWPEDVEKKKPKSSSHLRAQKIDRELKEILRWAENSFMSAETNLMMGDVGLDTPMAMDAEFDREKRERYTKALASKTDVPQLTVKTQEAKPEPAVEDFVNEIETLLKDFDIDLFPSIEQQ